MNTDIQKSCKNCKNNSSCTLIEKCGDGFDLETAVECKLEEGFLDEVLKEYLDLKPVFEQLQDEGIIKKNVNIKSIDIEGEIIDVIDKLSDVLWRAIVNHIGSIDIADKREKMTHDNFYCSEWE
jgi:hypothetical protein